MKQKKMPLVTIPGLFSEKEIAIIKLICQEKTHAQIAVELKINARTLEKNRHAILKKIKTKNAVGIVKYAIKNKIYVLK